jgi:hypothetical protein
VTPGCATDGFHPMYKVRTDGFHPMYKVRNPILLGYAGFYTVYYKDIGEFQILYLQDICW